MKHITIVCLLMGVAMAVGAEGTVALNEPIVYFDMTAMNGWNLNDADTRRRYFDETLVVAALQGLVNRDAPRLYIRYMQAPDDFWWGKIREAGGMAAGRSVVNATGLLPLLERFRSYYNGVVVWDERVPATSNLASTIAGCDNLLPVRYATGSGSLYQRIVTGGPRLPVVRRLMADDGGPLFTGTGMVAGTEVESSGSAKCDAYLWLIEHYVKPGRVSPARMGYTLDGYWHHVWQASERYNHTVTNQDFVIARRGVLFDLGVWDDETVIDDRNQPKGADAATLRKLLRAVYDLSNGQTMIHIAGFVPWAYKYTSHGSAGGTHDPVSTEWRYAEILSCHNAFMDADAISYSGMANASFFQHQPLAQHYLQNPKPTRESLTAAGILDASGWFVPGKYVAHYVGDYDAAAWLYWNLPTIWNDANRGREALSWAFNPNLCERFPVGMVWTRQTRTPKDVFIAGDSGAGYINPGHLSEPRRFSGLPSAWAVWEEHCRRFYEQWDLSVTGFIIDGYAPGMTNEGLDAYARFSPDGIVGQKVPVQGVHNKMPMLRMVMDLTSADPKAAAAAIKQSLDNTKRIEFLTYRSILKTPTWYAGVNDELRRIAGDEVTIVDLPTLLWLTREYIQHPERYVWPNSPYYGASEVSIRPGYPFGLGIPRVDDGPVVVGQYEGEYGWLIFAPYHYLYFSIDDAFYRTPNRSVDIIVTYLDAGPGAFQVHYDSTDSSAPFNGIYKETRLVDLGGTMTWKTEVFQIEDARFANMQNNAADFRIYTTNPPLMIGAVIVRMAATRADVQVR